MSEEKCPDCQKLKEAAVNATEAADNAATATQRAESRMDRACSQDPNGPSCNYLTEKYNEANEEEKDLIVVAFKAWLKYYDCMDEKQECECP